MIKFGPRIVKVLKANPSEEETVRMTGWNDYKHFEPGITATGSRMIKLLVQDVADGEFHFWSFFVRDVDVVSGNGKKVFIDKYGRMSFYAYSVKEIQDHIRYADPKPAKEGEEFLTTVLQYISHYSPVEGEASWRESMYNHGCNIENLFLGNVSGLNKLLEFYADRNCTVGCLFTKRGDYQNIEIHKDTIFPVIGDEVPPGYYGVLEKFINGFNPLYGDIDLVDVINKFNYENR